MRRGSDLVTMALTVLSLGCGGIEVSGAPAETPPAPLIYTVAGNGAGSTAAGIATIRDSVVIEGKNLGGPEALVTLTAEDSSVSHNLKVKTTSTDVRVEAELPKTLATGTFALSLDNGGGKADGAVTILQGEAGPAGEPGAKGDPGPKGDPGAEGPAGPKGDAGTQGVQGVAGQNGDQGVKGDAGQAGPQGSIGLTGDSGPEGPQGPAGPKGDKGDAADPGEIAALKADILELQQALADLPVWPEGSYCIFRGTEACPPGFQSEVMTMHNVQTDSPPSGKVSIGTDTVIYCEQGGCTADGVDQHYKLALAISACCK